MLQKEQSLRLGSNQQDFIEIRDHIFFHDLSWQDLLDKKLPVPWYNYLLSIWLLSIWLFYCCRLPDLDSETDTRHIDPEFTGEEISASVGITQNGNSLNNGQQNMTFVGFSYAPDNGFN